MKTKITILIIVVICLTALGFLVYQKFFIFKTEKEKVINLDPLKEKTHLSKVAETKNVYWLRAFDLTWNDIEIEKGQFDWSKTDEMIKDFSQRDAYLVATIKPFANWDQNTCHPEAKYQANSDPQKGGRLKVGKPCDMIAYSNFLDQAVERYDGDNQNDMPGLSIPIKYWEIMNEPEMQGGVLGGMGEELKFFVGTPQEYLDILKTSYQTIKKADQQAKVLPAGMAGMEENFQNFWRPIIENQGGNYFDIANIHSISTTTQKEDLYIIKYKKFLQQYGLSEKPIFITEVQFGQLDEKPADLKSFEILMAKSSIFALSLGADKLFYIDNWLMWDRKEKSPEEIEKEEQQGKKKKPDIPSELLTSSTQKVYLNLVDKINQFDKIEKIKEEYEENPNNHEGTTSKIGQYKFINGQESIYVLWGNAELPNEISEKIRVTDIYGNSKIIDASDLILTEEPIFIELTKN